MGKRIIPQDHYVYAHYKATTKELFYIGKGSGKRAWVTFRRSDWWKKIAKKHGVEVKILQDGLQPWAAYEMEKDLIALHGRKDEGRGGLINNCDGGIGGKGAKRSKEDVERQKVLTKSQMQDRQQIILRSEAQKKSWATSVERKEKHKLQFYKKCVCVETGQVFDSCADAALAIGVSRQSMTGVLKGRSKTSGGFHWKYA